MPVQCLREWLPHCHKLAEGREEGSRVEATAQKECEQYVWWTPRRFAEILGKGPMQPGLSVVMQIGN